VKCTAYIDGYIAFSNIWNLSIRQVTRDGQKLSGHLQQLKQDTINSRFIADVALEIAGPHYFINMN
jgi:hypothetical protein